MFFCRPDPTDFFGQNAIWLFLFPLSPCTTIEPLRNCTARSGWIDSLHHGSQRNTQEKTGIRSQALGRICSEKTNTKTNVHMRWTDRQTDRQESPVRSDPIQKGRTDGQTVHLKSNATQCLQSAEATGLTACRCRLRTTVNCNYSQSSSYSVKTTTGAGTTGRGRLEVQQIKTIKRIQTLYRFGGSPKGALTISKIQSGPRKDRRTKSANVCQCLLIC